MADIYQTRVVQKGTIGRERAVTYFTDPDEAKRYLEGFVEDVLELRTTEWREERSADEKWSMGLVPDQYARAVVMGVTVHESADEPLKKAVEIAEEVRA